MLLIRVKVTPGDDTLVNAASFSKFSFTAEKNEISGFTFDGLRTQRIVIARSKSQEDITRLWDRFQGWLVGGTGIWKTPDDMIPTHL